MTRINRRRARAWSVQPMLELSEAELDAGSALFPLDVGKSGTSLQLGNDH